MTSRTGARGSYPAPYLVDAWPALDIWPWSLGLNSVATIFQPWDPDRLPSAVHIKANPWNKERKTQRPRTRVGQESQGRGLCKDGGGETELMRQEGAFVPWTFQFYTFHLAQEVIQLTCGICSRGYGQGMEHRLRTREPWCKPTSHHGPAV